jgi:hypothetical protein
LIENYLFIKLKLKGPFMIIKLKETGGKDGKVSRLINENYKK